MNSTKPLTAATEIRITNRELAIHLREHHDFLWHYARKMARCSRCRNEEPADGKYRIYINGRGDFAIYHRCGHCEYPLHSYVDLSQERAIRRGLRKLWLTKVN
ncbi:hypothetical protein [Lewinella sp. IMCC34183]|uniref:hypothetical protein n=1 Tax=Lewinella sp. IMCC34183 TaxID=2248762 RepID=UPI000E2339F4|nr:hypothetical protein [Lewinella sp. IMCC34183]